MRKIKELKRAERIWKIATRFSFGFLTSLWRGNRLEVQQAREFAIDAPDKSPADGQRFQRHLILGLAGSGRTACGSKW
jgi:hypothetical protein